MKGIKGVFDIYKKTGSFLIKFPDNILYKIVYKDEDKIKAPKAYIVLNSANYLVVIFEDTKTIKCINHNTIITITEVRDNENWP